MSEFAPYETPPPPPAEPPPARGARLPADYYSLPPSEIKPIFPRGLRIGCGVASGAFLAALFALGAWLSGSGLGRLLSVAVQLSQVQLGQMNEKDVAAAQKTALDAELTALQKNVEAGRVSAPKVQDVLSTTRSAIRDGKLSRTEADQITKAAHDANASAATPRKTSP